MRSKLFKLLWYILAPSLSAVLLILAFPRSNQGWLGWIGLVPLFFAISGSTVKHGFFQALLCGMVFFALVFDWIFEVPGYTFVHHLILFVYLGLYFGMVGLTFSLLYRRCGLTTALFAAPFIWVSLEYIWSNMGFMAFPYAWLGYSQHAYPQVIQIASVTGAHGVSFLLVMVNSALTAIVYFFLYRPNHAARHQHQFISKRGVLAVVGTASFFTIVTLFYGIITISKPIEGQELRVSVVQGNIEQKKKWDPNYAKFIMQTYTNLTREASESGPDLIVWPEAATPRAISLDKKLYSSVSLIAKAARTYLLLGSSSHHKFEAEQGQKIKFSNSAFLISPEINSNSQRYDKIHLLPFGEYLPYRETIPWSWIDVPSVAITLPGKEFTVFQSPTFRFSAPICWENIFPQLPRKFVRNGAQFLVNITNEAWFGRSVGPQHYVISSIFRAVENRVYVVRCANTGISCFIDPYGRIVDKIEDDTGQDIFVRGVLTETIVPLESKTIYTRYGDWLVWLSFACSAIFVIFGLLRKEPGS